MHDNFCYFDFHPDFFCVKDITSTQTLLKRIFRIEFIVSHLGVSLRSFMLHLLFTLVFLNLFGINILAMFLCHLFSEFLHTNV